MDELKNKI